MKRVYSSCLLDLLVVLSYRHDHFSGIEAEDVEHHQLQWVVEEQGPQQQCRPAAPAASSGSWPSCSGTLPRRPTVGCRTRSGADPPS